ncbi:MAG: ABC transporter permease [bacterium]|nr:ABC transporter permease [bacterium]
MKFLLVSKEIKDLFRSKTAVLYFVLLFAILSYSYYSAVDLYSKASEAAVGNPLYAAGFEPVPGVFAPTLGGFFIIISLFAPFLFIQSVSNEKKHNTLALLAQLPYSLEVIFLSKICAAVILVVVSILFFAPVLVSWFYLGGHIPWRETLLLVSGYFLYSLFVIAVSYFSASVFDTSSQASIFTVAFIMISWFVDFGKEMHVVSLFEKLSEWTVTTQLKEFEDGILSLQALFYFLLLFAFFSLLAYYYFNFSLRKKTRHLLVTVLFFGLLFMLMLSVQHKIDISESRKNSFSQPRTEFLENLTHIDIKVYLEPTDSRYKDYQNDFLRKLKMVKRDVTVFFVEGEALRSGYGRFEYRVENKRSETFSNSEEEIFMILEEISGKKIAAAGDDSIYSGYPLVVKDGWSYHVFILYLFILPLVMMLPVLVRFKKKVSPMRRAGKGFKKEKQHEKKN